VAYWSTKATISLKRVQRDEQLHGAWRAYRNSPTLFERYHPPPPTASSSPRFGVRNPHPKTQNSNRYYLRNGRSYGIQIWPEHSQSPSEQKPIKISEKGSLDVGLPNFLRYPQLSQERVKLRTSNFVRTFTGSMRTKAH